MTVVHNRAPLSGRPLRDIHFLDARLHIATCGHETRSARWLDGRSYCPACWARGRCRADYCGRMPAWGDRCGFWWCEEHEQAAVLMTLGGDLGYKELVLGAGSEVHIRSGRLNWLYFAKAAARSRPDLLAQATATAARARLLRPGEERVIDARREEEEVYT